MRYALILLLAACAQSRAPTPSPLIPAPAPSTAPAETERTTLAAAGVDPTWMDRRVDPCDDLYRFACGGFLDRAEIPPDLASWRPATQLRKSNEEFLHDTFERARAAGDPVLGAYYGACMDEAASDRAGTGPIKPLLDTVAEVRDAASLERAIIALHKAGMTPYFGLFGAQDLKDSRRVIGWIDQSGLGLPDREYYVATDRRSQELREVYQAHVAKLFVLAGDRPDAAARAAKEVMRLETAIARIARPLVERRDSLLSYHKLDRAGVLAAARTFPWPRYFAALGVPDLQEINVTSPEYLGAMAALLVKERPAAWQPYLRTLILATAAPALGKAFVDEDFAMRRALTGQSELEPRWKICTRATNEALAEIAAQPYIAARYSARARAITLELLAQLRRATRADLLQLPWMDAATRAAAQAKLDKMQQVVGAPSKRRPYDFAISPTDHGKNVLASMAYEAQRSWLKIGKPVDPEDWGMAPVTVNAFYDPSRNSMNFPVGTLQPPLFSEHYAAAVNYGNIASTMAHELTHGFDDDGAKYDGDGNLHDWWSATSQAEFKARTQCVIEQYNAYEPLPGLKVNGALTVGENIADIGGVKLAFAAYREARRGQVPLIADGFTEDQLFYIAHAQGWCDKTRPEVVEMNLKSDFHTPRQFRVNGAVADNPSYAAAFSCAPGKPMNPVNRCEIW